MYVPSHFEATSTLLRSLLDDGALCDLVTAGPGGLQSTPLPLLLVEGSLLGHVARNNPQWQEDGADALVIVRGDPDLGARRLTVDHQREVAVRRGQHLFQVVGTAVELIGFDCHIDWVRRNCGEGGDQFGVRHLHRACGLRQPFARHQLAD